MNHFQINTASIWNMYNCLSQRPTYFKILSSICHDSWTWIFVTFHHFLLEIPAEVLKHLHTSRNSAESELSSRHSTINARYPGLDSRETLSLKSGLAFFLGVIFPFKTRSALMIPGIWNKKKLKIK